MGVKKEQKGQNGQASQGKARQPESAPERNRRPYQQPAFRWERVFETMALSCGKTSSTQSQCRFNRKTS